ncbi:phage tail tube protein [Photobacterium sp. MCCC 1A19761]|uniref:phage tail tube protein n=1 Tax=Photobacterium sp. MCCC 1A19761 TaxID=3115000 RepID=UPI00307EAB73
MTGLTEATKGAGTTFWRLADNASIETLGDFHDDVKWLKLAGIKDYQPGEITVADDVDDYLDDDETDWEKTKPGKKSGGEHQLTLAWKPGDPAQQQLDKDVDAGVTTWYRTKYPNGGLHLFYGYINSLGQAVPQNEHMTRTVKFKNVGKPKTAEAILASAGD